MQVPAYLLVVRWASKRYPLAYSQRLTNGLVDVPIQRKRRTRIHVANTLIRVPDTTAVVRVSYTGTSITSLSFSTRSYRHLHGKRKGRCKYLHPEGEQVRTAKIAQPENGLSPAVLLVAYCKRILPHTLVTRPRGSCTFTAKHSMLLLGRLLIDVKAAARGYI